MHQDQDDLDFYNGEESGELGSAYGDEDEEYDDADGEGEEAEVNEIRFFQPKFLSESAVQLRDKVERGRHMKAGIAWVGAFTGRDIVVSLLREMYLGLTLDPSVNIAKFPARLHQRVTHRSSLRLEHGQIATNPTVVR